MSINNLLRQQFLQPFQQSFSQLFRQHVKQNKILLGTLTGIAVSVSSFAANADELNWKPYNLEVVSEHIIPAYQGLDRSASMLLNTSKKLCANASEEQLLLAQNAFKDTLQAWQFIQHVNFGPIEYDMRAHSMQFWPDKKNHIGKQLSKLLATSDPKALSPEKFATASVAIKGLPAIERILYSKAPLAEIDKQAFRCDILITVSKNVSEIATSLHTEWKEAMLPQFKDSQQVDGYFEDDIDTATALLKTLVEPLEIIVDLKLKRPLGSEFGKQKYKRLESWRSENSLNNIATNIKSTRAMLLGKDGKSALSKYLNEKDKLTLLGQLTDIENRIDSFSEPLEVAITNQEGNAKVRTLMANISTLHESLEKTISSLDIHLGFNSRDGD